MKAPVRNFIIRDGTGTREAETLVLGRGVPLTTTAGGLPELATTRVGETQLMPSGEDDTQAIRDALATGLDVRLGPGTFTITDTLTLGAGGSGQRLTGCGVLRTRVRIVASGIPAFAIVSGHSGVEALRLEGNSTSTGVRAVSCMQVVLRDLFIGPMGTGIHLESVTGCEISGVDLQLSSLYGIYALGLTRATLRNIAVHYADTTGIHVENGVAVSCESVYIDEGVSYGIHLLGGSEHRLARIRTVLCDTAVAVVGSTGGTVCESVFVANGYTGLLVEQARDVSLSGCTALGVRDSLVIRSSANVVAGAIHSDKGLRTFPSPTHVVVDNSPGVFVTGMRVTGSATVDVSQAGSRVLFGPHNFNPASIVSGGNFAQL